MLNRKETILIYEEALTLAKQDGTTTTALRHLAKTDLFFLLVYVLRREDVNRDWLFTRCREVQHSPNGHLDLWAR